MSNKWESYTKQCISKIADEYRQKGYEVIENPSSENLPNFLQGFNPEIIATKDGHNEVASVKVYPVPPAEVEEVARLAEVLKPKKPEWSYKYAMKTVPVPDLILTSRKPLSLTETYKFIDGAERLLGCNQYVEAIDYVWPAIESILYSLAKHKQKIARERDIVAVIILLTQLGIIGQNDYFVLSTAADIRQASLNDLPLPYDFEDKLKQLPQVLRGILAEQEQLKKVG